MSRKTLLVTGATGKQGGAVINALLNSPEAAGFNILAVTRDTASKSARALAQRSQYLKLVQGDLNEPSKIFENAKQISSEPIWGAFSVQVR